MFNLNPPGLKQNRCKTYAFVTLNGSKPKRQLIPKLLFDNSLR